MGTHSAVAVNWTGPQRCYKSSGYSVFHKDETANVAVKLNTLFFNWKHGSQEIGHPIDEKDPRDVFDEEEEEEYERKQEAFLRPFCCAAPMADVEGGFYCLACTTLFEPGWDGKDIVLMPCRL